MKVSDFLLYCAMPYNATIVFCEPDFTEYEVSVIDLIENEDRRLMDRKISYFRSEKGGSYIIHLA